MKNEAALDRLIHLALQEDWGTGDLTTELCVSPKQEITGEVIAKSPLTVSGLHPFERVFAKVDAKVRLDWLVSEGDELEPGETLVRISGRAHSLLIGERPALNFLGRLCGIATQTRSWVSHLTDYPACRLVDTRKTTPGWRALEKAAVCAGGGGNHRMGLFDGILIKENHIVAAGGLEQAVTRAKAGRHHLVKIEVETTNLDEVRRAVAMEIDALMLDNMDNETMGESVKIVRDAERAQGRVMVIEASGNMMPDRFAAVAALGVDVISVGALTHSVACSDVSMQLKWN